MQKSKLTKKKEAKKKLKAKIVNLLFIKTLNLSFKILKYRHL